MPNIPFPNVPVAPGVPPLPRSTSAPARAASISVLQGMLWRIFQVDSQWGIFDSEGKALGDPAKFTGLVGNALEATGLGSTLSTGSVEYTKETRVSDFPIEGGGFASYNKVEMAAAPIVTLCLSGSEGDRRSFLEAIDAACKSTDLYSVATPEVTYANYSIERYNYQRRSSKGATLLIVEIALKEIRQVSAQYAKRQIDTPKDAGATPAKSGGKVQAKKPETSTALAIARKLGLSN